MAHQSFIYLLLVSAVLCLTSHTISGHSVRAEGENNNDKSLDISDDFPEEVIKACAEKCDHCYGSSDTLSRTGCFEKCEDEGPDAFTCSINGWYFFSFPILYLLFFSCLLAGLYATTHHKHDKRDTRVDKPILRYHSLNLIENNRKRKILAHV